MHERPPRLLDYTNIPFEIFILVFSILPFFLLAYFYTSLPPLVPVFLRLDGGVGVWAQKSVWSVFRVPLMALDTQLVCLLMKYAIAQSGATAVIEDEEQADYRREYLRLNARLWDWFRCLVAFKMSAESVDTIFLSIPRFNFLSRPAFFVTAIAGLSSIVAALFYGYRLLKLKRDASKKFAVMKLQRPVETRRVYGGVIYFNRDDPAMFVNKYVVNFGNRWSWLLLLCFVAYPLLVFATT